MNAHFEHTAFAVHGEDIADWDRFLRANLGGEAGMGGDAEGLGFRGGQILYPCGGMLEVISWLLPADDSNPVKRYVERFGPRAALHHLTFTVDDFDTARTQCEHLGYDVMPGRYHDNWKELYLRAPFLEPSRMLIQILQTDKDALKNDDGWDHDWDAFDRSIEPADPAATIVGVRLAVNDLEQATHLFCDLLGASPLDDGTLGWPQSSMTVRLQPGGDAADSHVVIKTVDGEVRGGECAGRLIRSCNN
jgi:catechol 2,3-dioxygenase-like lactoylglutathione lyase family enzyme